MNIGVKFCGQCNARIRLRTIYDELLKIDTESLYSFYKEENNKEYDLVIVLGGCPNECATINWDGEKISTHPELDETAKTKALSLYEIIKSKKNKKN